MKDKLFFLVVVFSFLVKGVFAQSVVDVKKVSSNKIDIIVSGKLFTSFCYPSDFEKPYMCPVYAPNGSEVTRGYPLAPRKGERVDHPHHVGLWFNHGNVNGLDFWNNSFAIKDKTKYGHIVVTKIKEVKSGEQGKITYCAEWRDNSNKALLEEETTFIITADKDSRTIDKITKLKALGKEVVFTDNKEGMMGIRVDRAFETPTSGVQTFTDEHGKPTKVESSSNNRGVNGVYYSSEGYVGGDVWSTRNNWVLLRGEKDGSLITFGFFDHPKNVGYPFHSHARGYGLFACNNLGSQSYNKADAKIIEKIAPKQTLTFHHRFYIESGKEVSSKKANSIFDTFSKAY